MVPQEETKLTNEGGVRVMNRAARRRKPLKMRYNIFDYIIVPENINTKPSHKYKKIREKNAKSNRQRAIVEARKARKENTSQVS